ncbi:hypothetical protein [Chryseobacterium gregarium]|uniref:hypothetical protein n=1 Tax=Chryseobacterium gregarium TaxID=456299 RepID=UPI0003FFB7D9|nr:hypothetical protein [Chryseobacterium gregarium]
MNTLNREQLNTAVADWSKSCGSYTTIKNLIRTNYVFNFDADTVEWVRRQNKNTDFCTQIGIYQSKLVAVLCPMDADGKTITVDNYPYSSLGELDRDLALTEIEEYTLVKNAYLSKDLRKINNNADMYLPVSGKTMLDQDKAVTAIESWRNDGMSWFYRESSEFAGARIFKKFYVPSDDLIPSKPGLTNIICSFGLKFSEVYQRVLPTLIFISFYHELGNGGSVERISNTYDWSEACPPLCKYM